DGRAPLSRASLDAPRGHDDQQDPTQTSRMPRMDDRQGPGSTAEMPRIDAHGPSDTGEFPRPELNGAGGAQQTGQWRPDAGQQTGQFAQPQSPQHTGQFTQPQSPQHTGQFTQPQSPQHTGQFAQPQNPQHTGQFAQPQNPQQTGQFSRPDAPQLPGGFEQQGGGSFVRSDVFGTPAPARQDDNTHNTGQFAAPQAYDGGSTGQHALPGRPQPAGNDYGAPRPPASRPQRPVRREPEALPPATGPGDGRTPLYDTLETNWFRGGRQQESRPAPQQPQAPQRAASSTTGSWRTSPNDEIVRQAERVRQPAAGGVTTSGLPRRVPRANLVPGTAQQQQHQSGPQVSRAPDDVRGRLTNLRRGIAQGRQAGNGQTGSFPSPTHQQER
ncbi:hypothetical protein ACLU3S_34320, partial [Streptomyces sp. AF1A]